MASALNWIADRLPALMLAGVLVLVGLSQVSRRASGALGVAFWIAVLFVGRAAYHSGRGLAVAGVGPLSPAAFYGLCAGLVAVNAAMAIVPRRGSDRLHR